MFRPIRRKKNELPAEAAEKLLTSARVGVLAVRGDDGYPYAVPINFLYDGETRRILFHGARVGHKAEAIAACDKVCFTVYGDEMIREGEAAWAPLVRSVVVFGRCHPVTDPEETLALVKRFAMKYYPDERTADEEIAQSGRAVRMYEITVEHISAKEVQER